MAHITNYESFCEQGIRGNNEDYILPQKTLANARLFVLCDGMGGHGHGEIASETICTAIYEYLNQSLHDDDCTAEKLQSALGFALTELNKADIYEDEKRMGTTLVVAVLNRYDILIGHIGDSRCYLFDEVGQKKFRTLDHSIVAEAVVNEILTEEEAFNSPKKNILTRCIKSGNNHVELTIDRIPNSMIEEGDILFICSDGVNDALRDNEIAALLTGESINTQLLQDECKHKSKDNYSGIFMQIDSIEKIEEEDLISHIEPNETIYSGITEETTSVNKRSYCPICGYKFEQEGGHSTTENKREGRIGQTNYFDTTKEESSRNIGTTMYRIGSKIKRSIVDCFNRVPKRVEKE